jgi:hypothetical protein
MKRLRKRRWWVALVAVLMSCSLGGASAAGPSQPQKYNLPQGVYIDLNKDFYDALQGGTTTTRTYTSDPQQEYLRRIAVSTEYMVKTNLTVIRQQERLIMLLESLEKQGRQSR